MTLQPALVAAAALANLALGFIVLLRNPRGAIHRYFALFSLSVAVWTLSSTFVFTYHGSAWRALWGHLAFAAASVIPLAFLLFASVFPTSEPKPPRRLFTILKTAGACAFLLSFTPLILKESTPVDGTLRAVYGPLHLPFGLYFVSCLGFSFFLLTRKLTVLKGVEKLQVRYLFLGVLTAGLGATITNLVIPLIFSTSQFSRYGPLFGFLMIAMIAHSVIRYRLMDIRVVIRKGVVYVCAIVTAASIFLLTAELTKRLTEKESIPVVQAVLVALVLAIFFQPLKNTIQYSFNRYLYRETYDYQRIIRAASRRLSTMLQLDPLLNHMTSVIRDTFKAEAVAIYLREHSAKSFKPWRPEYKEQWHDVGSSSLTDDLSPLVRYFEVHRAVLVREEALRDNQDTLLVRAAAALHQARGDLAFPLMDDRVVMGIVIVGPKLSGDPYFGEDIDLLDTLISQAAVAMKNAQLYREVVLVNEYVDNILSTMDSGVIAVGAAGDISLFNPAAERLTGVHAQSVHGKSYRYLPAAVASPLQDTLEASVTHSQFETSIPGPDTSIIPIVCSTAILRNKDRSTHGALIVFSDLTRLKDLEREKRRAARLASFGALASGVAHEIKNPLVAIRTFAELLPERFSDTDFREDFAKVVIKEIARIDDLVGRLRGLAATAPQQVGAVDIRGPIEETLALLRAQFEHTHTAVRSEFQDSPLLVTVEAAQLKQLFLNLFLNAIEAMGQGGELMIHVALKELRGEQWVVAEVSDTGPGIPDSVRTRIFDPFFTTKSRGSGLGLAICRGISDAHRGTIRAENRTDRSGTTIIVEFPANAEASVVAEEKLFHG
jgi:PAS domain S-box-containing protein